MSTRSSLPASLTFYISIPCLRITSPSICVSFLDLSIGVFFAVYIYVLLAKCLRRVHLAASFKSPRQSSARRLLHPPRPQAHESKSDRRQSPQNDSPASSPRETPRMSRHAPHSPARPASCRTSHERPSTAARPRSEARPRRPSTLSMSKTQCRPLRIARARGRTRICRLKPRQPSPRLRSDHVTSLLSPSPYSRTRPHLTSLLSILHLYED